MTNDVTGGHHLSSPRSRWAGRLAGTARTTGRAAALLPTAVLALATTARGDRAEARRRLAPTPPQPTPPQPVTPLPGLLRLSWHAVLTALLGLVSLLVTAVLVLAVARGLLYGLVDPGPYDDSWGGPSLAGAWLVHFLVSVPLAALAVLVLRGVLALQQHVTAPLRAARRPGWALPAVLLTGLVGVVFVVAFLNQ